MWIEYNNQWFNLKYFIYIWVEMEDGKYLMMGETADRKEKHALTKKYECKYKLIENFWGNCD